MRKKQCAEQIGSILDRLFPDPQIPLNHHDPFTLLIAVVLSAQCTDLKVNAITPKLFALAPDAETMALQSIEEVEKIIRPIGLSKAKSKALVNLSKLLMSRYGGKVPNTFEALESLPGVGHKTASVVMAQAFQIPAFPVDTHIHRCAKRWGLSNGKSVEQTEKDLKRVFLKETWIKRHLQIIYYARGFCPARAHKMEHCLICSMCHLA